MNYPVAPSLNEGRAGTRRFLIPQTDALLLSDVFGDHMLFCADAPIRVWGAAPAGTRVEIVLADETGAAVSESGLTVGPDGSFITELPPMPASFAPFTLTVSGGGTTRRIEDVLFGDLFLASGQSNMQVSVGECCDREQLRAESVSPSLRFYVPPICPIMTNEMRKWFNLPPVENDSHYPPYPSFTPEEKAGAWIRDDSHAIDPISAIAYTAAREYAALSGRPVGMLSLPVGGTKILSWLPRSAGDENAALRELLGAGYLADDASYNVADGSYCLYASLYMSKIAPVTPMAIRGLLWYQGESDEGEVDMYRIALEELITRWGDEFGFPDGSMPTVMCHIAPFNPGWRDVPVDGKVRFNLLFSRSAHAHPQTRAAVSIHDVDLIYACGGDRVAIHPRCKTPIGIRCARAMRELLTHAGDRAAFCPYLLNAQAKDDAMILRFASVGSGLSTSDKLPPRNFTIADESGLFYPADARIVAPDTVQLSSRSVRCPRYATGAYCFYNMKSNLVNSAGFPMEPFVLAPDNAVLYGQHDYSTCDFTEVWRYFQTDVLEEAGRTVPLFETEGASLSLTDDAVHGKALRLRGRAPVLSVILDYWGDTHSFNHYKTLSVCVRGQLDSVTVKAESGEVFPLRVLSSTPASSGFTRFNYALNEHTFPDHLSRLRLSFTGDAVVDEIVPASL
ncbi:MAG: hypothetical protein KIG36_05125 [Eubacteriales bacterium]|nr:hypothetical protein [Eubacteriales bacterium]